MRQILLLLWTLLQPFSANPAPYRKNQLALARLLLWSAVLAVFLFGLFGSSLIQAEPPPTIDSFETEQEWISLTLLESDASIASGPGILGGERDLKIERTGATGPTLEAGVSAGAFFYGQGPGLVGSARIEWDGPDSDPSSLDPTGLGGIDLTAGETQDAFSLKVSIDDLPANPRIEIFTDAGKSSIFGLSLPGSTYSPVDYVIPFSAFAPNLGGGAVLTDVGAITLFIDATTSLDLGIDSFDTTSLLTATKTDVLLVDNDGDGQAGPGDTLQYTIIITNPDDAFDAEAAGVVFSDTLDINTTLVVSSVTTTQGAVTSGNDAGDINVGVGVGTIADENSVTIMFEVTINNPLPAGVTEVANQGFVSSDTLTDLPTDDLDTGTVDDPTTIPVFATPVITATKADMLVDNGDGQLGPSDVLTYTVIITNSGNGAASGVVFSDTLPLSTTLVVSSVTTTQGTVTSGNDTGNTSVGVDVGTIAGAGGNVTITFGATINDPLPPGVTEVANQGTASGDNFAAVLTDDPDTALSGDPTITP